MHPVSIYLHGRLQRGFLFWTEHMSRWIEHNPVMVAVEGINNAGKSTFVKALTNRLEDLHLRVSATREPTDWLRRRLEDGTESVKDMGAWLEDRRRHCVEMRELMSQHRVVITDRYYWSTMAYQMEPIFGITKGAMERMNMGIIQPTLWVWLDIPIQTAQDRGKRKLKQQPNTPQFARDMDTDIKAEERAQWIYRRLALVQGYPVEVVHGDGNIGAQVARVARKIQTLAGITFDEENNPISPFAPSLNPIIPAPNPHTLSPSIYPPRPPALEDLPVPMDPTAPPSTAPAP